MRALELSKQSGEAERGVRERSVRASAPPPSPRNIAEDEIVAFGPSNKDDPEGNLAVTILPPDQVSYCNLRELTTGEYHCGKQGGRGHATGY